MSANNGVIRIGRKGIKKFAFGEDGAPFDVDVVVAFQEWMIVDEGFRLQEGEDVAPDDVGTIPTESMPAYHQAALDFVCRISGNRPDSITVAEALDFVARLREQYDELLVFFRPKSREERASPGSSGAELRFSAEGS